MAEIDQELAVVMAVADPAGGELLEDLLLAGDEREDRVEDDVLGALHFSANINCPGMHTGTNIITHTRIPHSLIESQNNDQASGHIFAQEITCPSADHDHRLLILVRFHVDSHPVTHISTHEEFPTSHGISQDVTRIPVNNDLSGVHCVAHSILSIITHFDRWAVHK